MTEESIKGSSDPAAEYVLKNAREANIETGWDRFEAMQDVCAFGDLGLCCRNCMLGPCRIDPFGEGPGKGICGISPDGMVARNLCRMVATGASAHSDHGAHIVEVLERIGSGEETDFEIKDAAKLERLARSLGLRGEERRGAGGIRVSSTSGQTCLFLCGGRERVAGPHAAGRTAGDPSQARSSPRRDRPGDP